MVFLVRLGGGVRASRSGGFDVVDFKILGVPNTSRFFRGLGFGGWDERNGESK